MDKISIIIPVHNGEKHLNKIMKCVLKQSYKNIELIFVENFSSDRSLAVLHELEKNEPRIVVLQSHQKGTSLARKKGVECATGKYTVFMDQDDSYVNNKALEKMHQTMIESDSDICQFSFYREFGFKLRKKERFTNKRMYFTAEEYRNKEIVSVLASVEGYFSASVWSKMYRTDILKDAVKEVNYPLFYAEDMFLNVCCLTSDKLSKVCVDKNAYYVWKTYTGFSSRDSGMALMKDYELIKSKMHSILLKCNSDPEVLFRMHQESLYFMLLCLKSKIYNMEKSEAYELIKCVNNFNYVKLAKDYMNNELEPSKKYEELDFLSSCFTPEEFYDRYKDKSTNNRSLLSRIKNRIWKGKEA